MKKHSHYQGSGLDPGKMTAAVLDSDATFSTRSSKTAPDWQRQRLLMKSIAVFRFKIISFLPLCGYQSVTAIVGWIKMTQTKLAQKTVGRYDPLPLAVTVFFLCDRYFK